MNFTFANLSNANLSNSILSRANFARATLINANLSHADLTETIFDSAMITGAILRYTRMIETLFKETNLSGCEVYGVSAWGVNMSGANQVNLIITPPDEPLVTVDDLEVAQFIYMLLNHKKLRNVLNTITERGVLILGRFGGDGLEVLQAIAAKLRELKYLPIIFDFERPERRNYTEIVKTLAGLSRFIIADLSGPSVPQELYATVPHFKIPFVPIIEKGRKIYSMSIDILEYPWVLRPPIQFANREELIELLPSRIIAPAEEKCKERQKLLDELFNI